MQLKTLVNNILSKNKTLYKVKNMSKSLKIYNNLSGELKSILQVKALIFHAYSNYDLYRLLKLSRVRRSDGSAFRIKDIDDRVKELKKLKLLATKDNVCAAGIIHQACIDGINDIRIKDVMTNLPKELTNYRSYYSYYFYYSYNS